MIDLAEQEKILGLIGKNLKKRVEAYLIGGSAMMYHGAKNSTRDIDIVFINEKDRTVVEDILRDLEFKPRSTKLLYAAKKNVPILLQRDEIRLNLFCKIIICFELSESIIDRVKAVYEFDNLIIKVVAPEDIILLKCATERAGDRLDAAELIRKYNINWNIIVEEAEKQSQPGKGIFSVFLYDFLMELKEDLNVEVPKEILNKLMSIGERAILKAIKEGNLVREDRTRKKWPVGNRKRRKG